MEHRVGLCDAGTGVDEWIYQHQLSRLGSRRWRREGARVKLIWSLQRRLTLPLPVHAKSLATTSQLRRKVLEGNPTGVPVRFWSCSPTSDLGVSTRDEISLSIFRFQSLKFSPMEILCCVGDETVFVLWSISCGSAFHLRDFVMLNFYSLSQRKVRMTDPGRVGTDRAQGSRYTRSWKISAWHVTMNIVNNNQDGGSVVQHDVCKELRAWFHIKFSLPMWQRASS